MDLDWEPPTYSIQRVFIGRICNLCGAVVENVNMHNWFHRRIDDMDEKAMQGSSAYWWMTGN